MRVKAIFLSDLHLGVRHCRIRQLQALLESISAEDIYLVGDVIDFQKLGGRIALSDTTWKIIRSLSAKARDARIHYIVGNHDIVMNCFTGFDSGNLVIERSTSYAAAGKRYLVLHGDQFDAIVFNGKASFFGELIYAALVELNTLNDGLRGMLGWSRATLSYSVKTNLSGAKRVIDRFKGVVASYARDRGFDGVICGHIHYAEADAEAGYFNCGDWTENGTFLYDSGDGIIRLGWFGADHAANPGKLKVSYTMN